MDISTFLQDGSPWLVLACLGYFVGLVIALTPRGGGIDRNQPCEPRFGGKSGAGYLPEAIGRAELELLWGHHYPPRRAVTPGAAPGGTAAAGVPKP